MVWIFVGICGGAHAASNCRLVGPDEIQIKENMMEDDIFTHVCHAIGLLFISLSALGAVYIVAYYIRLWLIGG